MVWRKNANPSRYKKSQIVLVIILCIFLVAVGVGAFYWLRAQETDPLSLQTDQQQTVVEESPEVSETGQAEFDALKLQAALDAWYASAKGTSSVAVATSEGELLASINPDEIYFAASLYKLYVAYEGYRQIDSGAVDSNELFVQGNTRLECLDLMIRESDSPCAEAWWAEYGREQLGKVLESYGLTKTNMVSLQTTAADVTIMLARIAQSDGLTEDSQQRLLASMRDQIYDDTFDLSFADSTVYNKIGFREFDEYHDVAIVEFPDGRKLIISALTSGVGTRGLVALGDAIESASSQPITE